MLTQLDEYRPILFEDSKCSFRASFMARLERHSSFFRDFMMLLQRRPITEDPLAVAYEAFLALTRLCTQRVLQPPCQFVPPHHIRT